MAKLLLEKVGQKLCLEKSRTKTMLRKKVGQKLEKTLLKIYFYILQLNKW